jgi:TPR repeat protein
MARLDFCELDAASLSAGSGFAAGLGMAPAETAAPDSAESFYQLGMMSSVGTDGAADLVSAHKWFNLAAMKGNRDAVRLRQEIAAQMSPAEIAAAQRAARAWLTAH